MEESYGSDEYLLKEEIFKTQEGISLFEKKERNGVSSDEEENGYQNIVYGLGGEKSPRTLNKGINEYKKNSEFYLVMKDVQHYKKYNLALL